MTGCVGLVFIVPYGLVGRAATWPALLFMLCGKEAIMGIKKLLLK